MFYIFELYLPIDFYLRAMKFLIVDDHELLREGLAGVLRQFDADAVVLHAADGERGLQQAQAYPDLAAVLVDLRMAGLGGLGTLAALTRLLPGVPAIMLSSSEDPADVRAALAAGARGYCPKSAGNQTLMSALRLVLAGDIYVPPLMALEDSSAAPAPTPVLAISPAASAAPVHLTERQHEVLRLLGQGQPNKEIARALGLSAKTTKAHITAIFRGLNVLNRTQAVLAARAAGLL